MLENEWPTGPDKWHALSLLSAILSLQYKP